MGAKLNRNEYRLLENIAAISADIHADERLIEYADQTEQSFPVRLNWCIRAGEALTDAEPEDYDTAGLTWYAVTAAVADGFYEGLTPEEAVDNALKATPDAIARIYVAADGDAQMWWHDFVDDLQDVLPSHLPSLRPVHQWCSNGMFGVVANKLITVYVSGYGPVVCVDVVPCEDCGSSQRAFANQFAAKVVDVLQDVYKASLVQPEDSPAIVG